MKIVFEKLRNIQIILEEQFKLEEEIGKIPVELNDLKSKFVRTERDINNKEQSKEHYNESLKELKKEKEVLNLNKEKYENQMPLIKTQKEYESITSEIAQINERIEKIEEEELISFESLEDINKIVEEQKNVYTELKEKIEVKEKEVSDLLEEKHKELDKLLEDKKKISEGIEEEIIYKFEKIVKNKGGRGIVPIKNNVCMGCNMILPPQFVNDVRRESDLIFCPNCSRILYYFDEEKEKSEGIVI